MRTRGKRKPGKSEKFRNEKSVEKMSKEKVTCVKKSINERRNRRRGGGARDRQLSSITSSYVMAQQSVSFPKHPYSAALLLFALLFLLIWPTSL